MRCLKDNDFRMFEQLCALPQQAVKKTMSTYLKSKYKKFIETDKYIYTEGDIPIALVAHMDTVFPHGTNEVYYDRQKNVIWSPNGLGADDRAGIYAIIQIVKAGLRPHIILTTDEEKGVIGASALVQDIPSSPFNSLKFMVQLDRRGADDCVFYDCFNKEFIEYVESFGFVEAFGSFSDISVIAPAWGIAAVNLSIGYRDEHSISETLFVGQMLNTIDKVKRILCSQNIPEFKYIASPFQRRWSFARPAVTANRSLICKGCKKTFTAEDLIETKEKGKNTFASYCIDCIGEAAEWCSCCGEAYERGGLGDISGMCEDCYYEFYYNY